MNNHSRGEDAAATERPAAAGRLARVNGQIKKYHFVIGPVFMAAMGFLDYVTGFEFRMEIFYLMPVSYAAWFIGRKTGIAASVASVAAILCSDILSGKKYYNFPIDLWNLMMYFVVFVIVTLLLSALRGTLQQRQRLIMELQTALREVKELSGILPICANCKKIRDDQGYWQDVAVYISKHTNAEFTHGLCSECMEKLYPAYTTKKRKT